MSSHSVQAAGCERFAEHEHHWAGEVQRGCRGSGRQCARARSVLPYRFLMYTLRSRGAVDAQRAREVAADAATSYERTHPPAPAESAARAALESCEALEEEHDNDSCDNLEPDKYERDGVQNDVKHEDVRLQANVV